MPNDQKHGQAIAEYLILTALIAIASIGIIQVLSKNMRGKLGEVNAALIGDKTKTFTGTHDTQRQTRMLDMGDFNGTLTDTGKNADNEKATQQ